MIARWPGTVKPGTVSDHVWAFWDFLPTIAELVAQLTPSGIDGISILPTLLGEKAAGRRQPAHSPLYWEFHEGGFAQAVRTGHWKYVRQKYSDRSAMLWRSSTVFQAGMSVPVLPSAIAA